MKKIIQLAMCVLLICITVQGFSQNGRAIGAVNSIDNEISGTVLALDGTIIPFSDPNFSEKNLTLGDWVSFEVAYISGNAMASGLLYQENTINYRLREVDVLKGIFSQRIPPYCTLSYGICIIDVIAADFTHSPGEPYESAGFDGEGNFVLEFSDYDFRSDEWLGKDKLLFEGDYDMPFDVASKLGGHPFKIPAGEYDWIYSDEKKKIVKFQTGIPSIRSNPYEWVGELHNLGLDAGTQLASFPSSSFEEIYSVAKTITHQLHSYPGISIDNCEDCKKSIPESHCRNLLTPIITDKFTMVQYLDFLLAEEKINSKEYDLLLELITIINSSVDKIQIENGILSFENYIMNTEHISNKQLFLGSASLAKSSLNYWHSVSTNPGSPWYLPYHDINNPPPPGKPKWAKILAADLLGFLSGEVIGITYGDPLITGVIVGVIGSLLAIE